MIIVLDASAAIELVLQREKSPELGRMMADADWVIAPALMIPEVANVFWKYFQFNDMPVDQCEQAIDRVMALPDEYVYEIEICKEAFTMSCITGKPVYDMFYLVLARRHSGYLLTMDNQLKKIAVKHSVRVL
jgi:predicted nucleic acid-binding protein